MNKVHVIESYSTHGLEKEINNLLELDYITVTNIQYQATSLTSSREPLASGETSFGGSIYHTALIEYVIHKE